MREESWQRFKNWREKFFKHLRNGDTEKARKFLKTLHGDVDNLAGDALLGSEVDIVREQLYIAQKSLEEYNSNPRQAIEEFKERMEALENGREDLKNATKMLEALEGQGDKDSLRKLTQEYDLPVDAAEECIRFVKKLRSRIEKRKEEIHSLE